MLYQLSYARVVVPSLAARQREDDRGSVRRATVAAPP